MSSAQIMESVLRVTSRVLGQKYKVPPDLILVAMLQSACSAYRHAMQQELGAPAMKAAASRLLDVQADEEARDAIGRCGEQLMLWMVRVVEEAEEVRGGSA